MPRSPNASGPVFGCHMSIAGGLHKALVRGRDADCEAIQIFTGSNQQWRTRKLTAEERESWATARAETGVQPLLAHARYLINLASPDRQLARRSLAAMATEIDLCGQLDIPYLVVHPGAHMERGEAAGIERIAEALNRLVDRARRVDVTILLENTAGQGSSIGHRLEHLRDILGAVDSPTQLGICFDTCHALAAGYDLGTARGVEEVFALCDRLFGIHAIRAFHVNDSKRARHSRVDRHEHIGRGHVGLEGFRCIVNEARFAGLPMILETPKPSGQADRINLAVLRALVGRKRVGSRARALASRPL